MPGVSKTALTKMLSLLRNSAAAAAAAGLPSPLDLLRGLVEARLGVDGGAEDGVGADAWEPSLRSAWACPERLCRWLQAEVPSSSPRP